MRHDGATRKEPPWNGDTRAQDGIIVTLREQTTLHVESVVRMGPPSRMLRELCEELDTREGDWRVVCVSSPSTIWRDLQGSRIILNPESDGIGNLKTPEENMLSSIGRLDRLEEKRASARNSRTRPSA